MEEFENAGHFEASFDPRLAVLPARNAGAVRKALGVLLKSAALIGNVPKSGKETVIRAEISIRDRLFCVSARSTPETNGFSCEVTDEDGKPCQAFYREIRQNAEEEGLSCFSPEKGRYSDRLMQYKDTERFYPAGRFAELTDGVGNTRLFRACLNEYIRALGGRTRVPGGGLCLAADSAGRLIPGGGGGPTTMSKREEALFEYLCFVSLNRFWQNVEEIRDIHHVCRPLFITGLPELCDGTAEASAYLQKALSLERQIFVCCPAFHETKTIHYVCCDHIANKRG